MTQIVIVLAAIIALLEFSVPANAAACTRSIARVQSQIDAAIEARAGTQPWQPESLSALRGNQPTPRSLAAVDGSPVLQQALRSLDRARDADRVGNLARCNLELRKAKAALRQRDSQTSVRSGA